jgi:predicted glycoside hydrolase/deacetylase ChbG (UPF0249 family)
VKRLIVNADDFGASTGVNRGILECHTQGVVTSASLMTTGRAAREAAAIAKDHPELSVGLHWDVYGEDERDFDTSDADAVRDELKRQIDAFVALVGREPTHVDSHRHAHREAFEVFRETVAPLGVPLREDGRVTYIGGFYGQWEWKKTDLRHVSVAFLSEVLAHEVGEGWTELACHPGYMTPDYKSVYSFEREVEIRTLTDPRIREMIDELSIVLRSYNDVPRPTGGPSRLR